jgi:hypothetical protein
VSNRRRITRRPQSYTARLQRPAGARRPTEIRRRLRSTVPILAVLAELGHLGAAYVEWPDSTVRGAYHVVAGALLGLVAAALATGTGRYRFAAGAVVALAGPAAWLIGTLLDASPYRHLPAPAAIGVIACEIALTALLLPAAWRPASPAAREEDAAGRTRRSLTGTSSRRPA